MSFSDIMIPLSLTTSSENPIKDLFVPILKEAVQYDIAVGYFTTGWMRDAAEGIASLAINGGKARWVISPSLTKEDWEMLSSIDPSKKSDLINDIAKNDIDELIQNLKFDTRNTLSWLIADGVLTFRIAVPTNELNGIFHAKIGIFTDKDGSEIAISGSYNFTSAAQTNWEVIDVYSQDSPSDIERIKRKKNDFSKMWENLDPNLDIYKPNESSIRPFINITRYNPRPYSLQNSNFDMSEPKTPSYFLDENDRLRKHQENALHNWFKNNGHGIFNMATGSGKTVTALVGITRLYNEIKKKGATLVVIITVPYKHLAEQWSEEAGAFGFKPLMCYGDYKNWPTELGEALTDIDQSLSKLIVIITVNRTYSGSKFQGFLSRIKTNFLIIADEMHNLGAKKIQQCLPNHAQFRIGLSATPVRKNDDEGSKLLENYFGKQIIQYGIQEAIRDGTLTEYYYYPVLVEFTEEEMAEYKDLSIRIGRLFSQGITSEEEGSPLNILLIKRGRLIGRAENKLVELKRLLLERKDSKYNLVYVGDDKTDDIKQVERVLSMIGNDVGMKANKFTSVEKVNERRQILKNFGTGELQTIVAIRCLDEGVDIPRTETAYILASSTNPRQFIQRRGRVLRKSQGKKYAYIYDFITIPPSNTNDYDDNSSYSAERKLMARELERINEFTNSAYNGGEAQSKLRAIKKRLNLLDK